MIYLNASQQWKVLKKYLKKQYNLQTQHFHKSADLTLIMYFFLQNIYKIWTFNMKRQMKTKTSYFSYRCDAWILQLVLSVWAFLLLNPEPPCNNKHAQLHPAESNEMKTPMLIIKRKFNWKRIHKTERERKGKHRDILPALWTSVKSSNIKIV